MSDDSSLVASQYADYLKVNLLPGSKAVEESIDETLTRLDEYSSLIDMVKTDSGVDLCTALLRNKQELELIFERVRRLELMVQRIRQDVDKAEELVINAESDFGVSTEGKLRNILKPFFRRANTIPPPSQRNRRKNFTSPEFFQTKEFFSQTPI